MSKPKTVLITGASSGFGAATANLLAKEGHKLILVARRLERLQELQKSLPTDVYIASVDVTDKDSVAAFFALLPAEFSKIDVLINNAGLALGMLPAQESKLEDWEQMVDTNIKGLLRMTKPVLDFMVAQNQGMIINLGSVAGHNSYKGGHVYAATKAFVRHFSRNLRLDLFGTRVKITTIEPGAAETEFSIVRFSNKKQADDFYAGWQPLTAEDVANTIVWTINQPAHVNIDNVEILPLDQTFGGNNINRPS